MELLPPGCLGTHLTRSPRWRFVVRLASDSGAVFQITPRTQFDPPARATTEHEMPIISVSWRSKLRCSRD
eukprot:14727133-Alexandrium_andersonii.AAC.1